MQSRSGEHVAEPELRDGLFLMFVFLAFLLSWYPTPLHLAGVKRAQGINPLGVVAASSDCPTRNAALERAFERFQRKVARSIFRNAWEAHDAYDVLGSGETKIELVAPAGKIFRLIGHGKPIAANDAGSVPTFSGRL